MSQQNTTLAYMAAVLNAVIIGFSFLFIKIALAHADPIDTMAYRFAISFGAMAVWLPVLRRDRKPSSQSFKRIIPLALLYPIGFFTLQTFGMQTATSAEGGMLLAFIPVLTMLVAAAFLKERLSPLQSASIVVSACGVCVMIVSREGGMALSGLSGILLLLLSCMTLAGYNVMAKSLLKAMSPATVTFWMQGAGFVAFVSASLTMHAANDSMHKLLEPLVSLPFVASVLFLGLLSSLVTAFMANYALSKLDASRAAVFANLSTIVSIAAGALFLGETITVWLVIGAALIIAGVIGANRNRPLKAEGQLQVNEHR